MLLWRTVLRELLLAVLPVVVGVIQREAAPRPVDPRPDELPPRVGARRARVSKPSES